MNETLQDLFRKPEQDAEPYDAVTAGVCEEDPFTDAEREEIAKRMSADPVTQWLERKLAEKTIAELADALAKMREEGQTP